MIDNFKIGYYYKFVGNKNKYFYYDEDMKIALSGKVRKLCLT
jgi:hypothetical protein